MLTPEVIRIRHTMVIGLASTGIVLQEILRSRARMQHQAMTRLVFLRYNALADTPGASLTLETAPTPVPSVSEHATFVRAILTLTRGTGDSAVIRKIQPGLRFCCEYTLGSL